MHHRPTACSHSPYFSALRNPLGPVKLPDRLLVRWFCCQGFPEVPGRRACAWLELFYLRLANCPSPTRRVILTAHLFRALGYWIPRLVGTDSTLTLLLLGGFQFLQPTLCPESFFWSLLISPSRSHPLKLKEAHQPSFIKRTNPVLCYGFFLFLFLQVFK